MTATGTAKTTTVPWLVGDRVPAQYEGQLKPGRFSSIHHVNDGIDYVVRAQPADPSGSGGTGEVLNRWTSSGRSSFLTTLAPAAPRGAR